MKKNIALYSVIAMSFLVLLTSCQKMHRPELGEIIQDPPPPVLDLMDSKSYWAFDENTRDTGVYKMATTANNVSLVESGVTDGKAAQIGDGGYLMINNVNDELKTPGSLSISFWLKGIGPVDGGAQGLFAISKSTQFWGNFEVFLENDNNQEDPSEGYIKVHLFNLNAADGVGEQWVETKVSGLLNNWSHIAITYNGASSEISIFVNGEATDINKKVLDNGNYGNLKFSDVSGISIGTFAFQTSPNLTNHGPESWAKSFNGPLDQFRIFTRVLSSEEVKNMFDNKL